MAVSFIYDIEEVLIAQISSRMGVGSVVYPTPHYLQVRFVGRAAGRPIPLLPEQELPAIWIEYLSGAPRKGEIGHPWVTAALESFNVLGLIRLTPEILGCAADVPTFSREAEGAVGTLLRRLMHTLLNVEPGAHDELLDYKTNGQRLGGWAYNGVTRGEFVIDYSLLIRYESLVTI